MFRSKIFALTGVVMFIFGIANIDCAAAAEKMKSHGTSITTKWQQMKVGDEEGHVLATSEEKQIYINNKTGEKHVSICINNWDINLKTGQGTLKGYGVSTYPNGDKIFRRHEGKTVGKGHWKGTYSYIKGTGKYERVKGKGIWDAYSLAPQMSYMEVEGKLDMPK
jgi:hypothetical protein